MSSGRTEELVLAKASDDRKARLLALKKRKAGEAVDNVYVFRQDVQDTVTHSSTPVLQNLCSKAETSIPNLEH